LNFRKYKFAKNTINKVNLKISALLREMGLLDRTKTQTNNTALNASNSTNAKFGAKKGSYSLAQVILFVYLFFFFI
jgi:hypothetical protein